MHTFAELLKEYTTRAGISDAELARSIGVRRQTVFRWKEGIVSRPRHRDDVLGVARKLRLNAEECDKLLIAAGFHPEGPVAVEPAPAPAARPETTIIPPARDEPERENVRPPHRAPEVAKSGMANTTRRLFWLAGVAGVLIALLFALDWIRPFAPALPVAGEGETLLLVGEFVNFAGDRMGFNVAGRLAEALAEEVAATTLPNVRVAIWPRAIRNQDAAEAALSQAGGEMIIWGEYDSGRVLAHLTTSSRAPNHSTDLEALVASPAELSATINSDLPQEIRYVALVTLGQLYKDVANYAQAQTVLLRALAHPPQEDDALDALYFRLGYVHQLDNPPRLDEAVDFYGRLLDRTSDRKFQKLAHYNRGLSYLVRQQQGDLDRAIAEFTQTVHLDRNDANAYTNRGVAYFYRNGPGDAGDATADFSEAIALAPEQHHPYYNRGLLHIRLDDHAVWEPDLIKTVELAPGFGDGHAALCWAYVLDEMPAKALPHCDRAIELGSFIAHNSRGMAYTEMDRYTQAAADFIAFLTWLDEQPADSPYQRYRAHVEAWLAALEQGNNPLTEATLARLRVE